MLADCGRKSNANCRALRPQKPNTIARSLAIGNPADGPFALRLIRESGGWSEDVSDPEIIDSIKLLAGDRRHLRGDRGAGVTAGVAAKLIQQGRIGKDETNRRLYHRQRSEDHRRDRRRLPRNGSHRAKARRLRSAVARNS